MGHSLSTLKTKLMKRLSRSQADGSRQIEGRNETEMNNDAVEFEFNLANRMSNVCVENLSVEEAAYRAELTRKVEESFGIQGYHALAALQEFYEEHNNPGSVMSEGTDGGVSVDDWDFVEVQRVQSSENHFVFGEQQSSDQVDAVSYKGTKKSCCCSLV